MYIPPAFADTDRSKLLAFIDAHSIGLVVARLVCLPPHCRRAKTDRAACYHRLDPPSTARKPI